MIWPLFKYVVLAAIRDKLFLSVICLLAVTLSLSFFFASTVVTEQDQFARVFSAYGFRLFGSSILAMFVTSYVRRSFEARDIEYLLSRPIGRVSFIFTHAMSFSFIAFCLSVILGLSLFLIMQMNFHAGFLLWWTGLLVEFIVMANVAMFFAMVMTSASACMAIVFCFYLLSRLMGEILGILQKGASGTITHMLGQIMEFISIFIPRLDLLGQTKWILYGVPNDIDFGFILGQCVVFLCLIIGASIIDMHKRQF